MARNQSSENKKFCAASQCCRHASRTYSVCDEHFTRMKCLENECRYARDAKDSSTPFCPRHKMCTICGSKRQSDSQYCFNHKCRRDGCVEVVEGGLYFCAMHKCQADEFVKRDACDGVPYILAGVWQKLCAKHICAVSLNKKYRELACPGYNDGLAYCSKPKIDAKMIAVQSLVSWILKTTPIFADVMMMLGRPMRTRLRSGKKMLRVRSVDWSHMSVAGAGAPEAQFPSHLLLTGKEILVLSLIRGDNTDSSEEVYACCSMIWLRENVYFAALMHVTFIAEELLNQRRRSSMRFGQQLRSSLIKDWYYYYIAYDDLKKSLRTDFEHTPAIAQAHKKRQPWSEEDERRFVNQLEQELDKVFTFQKVKSQEIIRRIKASEKEVQDVIDRAEAAQNGDDRAKQNAPSEDEFLLLEEDLSDIIADVHDIAKFTQLNYTGFQKIIKKHDKQTHWHLKPVFAARLNARPFFKHDYDSTVVNLSKLYDQVRTRGNPTKGDSSAGGKQQNFVRQTTKYWVHPDNITELKLIILKHLPVLVFNPSKEFEKKDSAISSIYYDNPETWELYEGRLKKTEGAEAIRLRWYGGMEVDTIFVERKTHREDWTGEKSVKARFSTKEKNVNAYLKGDMTTEQIFEKMRKDGKKSEKEINDLEQLAKEIQFRVIDRKLVPVCRSFYNRTAFQLPGDARVRVSLDTELTMVREDNLDGRQRAGKNWRRMDIGIDYPFEQLPPEDVERFPYGVLEVKLQTAQGQEPPEWIRELTASHLVEAVPKFSKFIHGCATLFPTRINLLPFWFPQMDTDIRKPVSHKFGIERPGQSTDVSTSAAMDDDSDDELDDDDDLGEDENTQRLRAARDALEQHEQDRHLASNGHANGDVHDQDGNIMDEEERMAHKPLISVDDDYPIYDSDDDEEALEDAKKKGGLAYRWKLVKWYSGVAGDKLLYFLKQATPFPTPTQIPLAEGRMGIPRGVGVSEKRFKAPKGKKIHVPVRVEPKVSFAAERTFLAWLEFSIILGSIAATLMNFGDRVGLAASIAFTILAIIALFYSMGIFLWRVDRIKQRKAVQYHDKWGPSALCVGLLACVTVAIAYRFKYGGEGDLRGRNPGRRPGGEKDMMF
ncbi:hypothetical protein AC578_6936 [Pseudocercospora eumusae]|uniref:Vacuolar transporter chaperone complex subunit 4 n=1 Tax=Pseudocercospora eumusae TaxID=321146 RepID=A0A139GYC8_9PEZI|nr:hypothetical protein AC578_6936 [Pseudocercospora eumusae]